VFSSVFFFFFFFDRDHIVTFTILVRIN